MWFRRKKKTDPDSALTETLTALQTLLEDEDTTTTENRSEPEKTSVPDRFDPPMEQSDSTSIPTLHSEMKITDATNQDPESTQTPVKQTETSPEQPEATAEVKQGSPFDIEFDDDLFEDPKLNIQGYPNPDAPPQTGDSIPVLQNVVYMPARNKLDEAVGVGPELYDSADRKTGLADVEVAVVQIVIDECIAHLAQRLEQRRLAPLGEEQEEKLREVLAAMLETGDTTGSE